MKINVTKKDIKNAGHTGRNCPIALATKRKIKDMFVYVGNRGITFHNRDHLMERRIPDKAKVFINQYDGSCPELCMPFKFSIIDLPKRFIK